MTTSPTPPTRLAFIPAPTLAPRPHPRSPPRRPRRRPSAPRCAVGNVPAVPNPPDADAVPAHLARGDRSDLLRLALPSYIAQVTEPAASLVDMFWVGRVGALPLAGAAVGSALFNMCAYVFSALSYCANARIAAQTTRAGTERAAAAAALVALYLGLAVALLVLLAAPPLTRLMGAAASTARFSVHYLRTRALGLPFLLVFFALSGVFRGLKDLRRPLHASALGAAVNMMLDPALMAGAPFAFGVAGAGLATSAAAVIMVVYLLVALARDGVLRFPRGLRGGRVRRVDAAAVLGPLVPLSAKRVLESSALAFCCAVAARLGPENAAAMEIAQQCWWTVGVLWWPLGVAASAVIAGLVARGGKSERRRALAIANITIRIVAALSLAGAAFVFAASGRIPRVFVAEEQFAAQASRAVRYLSLVLPVSAIVDAMDFVLIATGQGKFVFTASAVGVGVCVAVLKIMPSSLGMIWTALGLMCAVQAFAVSYRLLWLSRGNFV